MFEVVVVNKVFTVQLTFNMKSILKERKKERESIQRYKTDIM